MRRILTIICTVLVFSSIGGTLANAQSEGFPYTSKTEYYSITFPVKPGPEEFNIPEATNKNSKAYSSMIASFHAPDKGMKVRYRITMEPVSDFENPNVMLLEKVEKYQKKMEKKQAIVVVNDYTHGYRWGREIKVRFGIGEQNPIVGRTLMFNYRQYVYFLEALGNESLIENPATDLFFDTLYHLH